MRIEAEKLMRAIDTVGKFSSAGSAIDAAYKSVVFEKYDDHLMNICAGNFFTAGRMAAIPMEDWGTLPERFLLDTQTVSSIIKNSEKPSILFSLDESTNQIVVDSGATYRLNYRINSDGIPFGQGEPRQVFSSRQLIPFLSKVKLFTATDSSNAILSAVNLTGSYIYAFSGFVGMRVQSEMKALSESLSFAPDVVIDGITAFSSDNDSEFAYNEQAIFFYQGNMAFRSQLQQGDYPSDEIDRGIDKVLGSSEAVRIEIRTAELKQLVSRASAFKLADDSKNVKFDFIDENHAKAIITDSSDNQRIEQTVMVKSSANYDGNFSMRVRIAFLDSLTKLLWDKMSLNIFVHDNVVLVNDTSVSCFSSVVK